MRAGCGRGAELREWRSLISVKQLTYSQKFCSYRNDTILVQLMLLWHRGLAPFGANDVTLKDHIERT